VFVEGGFEPPYFLTTVTADAALAVVEVAANGPWSPQLGEEMSAALRACLAGPPVSIIVDLCDLADPDGASLPFWLSLWTRAEPVHLVFCLPAATTLGGRLRDRQGPQARVFADVPAAHTGIADRLSRDDRMQARLEPRPASVRAARALVTEACAAWHLPELLADTWLIVSELAANAVEHARTDFVVTVSCRGARLHVAIHDYVSRFPSPAERDLVSERGRGLRLVHTVAAAWGAMPTRDGKVVWATVR